MVSNIGPREILDPEGEFTVPESVYEDRWGGVVERIIDPEGTWVSSISRPTWKEIDVDGDYDQYIKPGATGSTGESSTGDEPKPEWKNKLTDGQLDVALDIADEIGAGSGADEWTTQDVLSATSATDSKDQVRTTAKQLRDHGWAEQTDKDSNGAKIHRLTEDPRGEVSGDGGFRDEYRLDHDWDLVLENFENRDDIFEVGTNDTQLPDNYPDWFCYNQRDHIVEMFEETRDLADSIYQIHRIRSDLDENWNRKAFREDELDDIRDELGVLRRHFRNLHGKLRDLTLTFLDNVMKFRSIYKKINDISDKNLYSQSRRPEELKSGKNGRKGFLHAISIAINDGHLGGLIERQPSEDKHNREVTDYIYEAERNIGYYLEMMWEIAEHLLGDIHRDFTPVKSTEDTTTSVDDGIPSRGQLDSGVSLVLECVEQADDSISWEELKNDFNDRAANARRPTTILMNLKNAHQWCLDTDGSPYGIRVEDETHGTGKNPDIQIELIDEPSRSDFFEKRSHMAEWHENRDLPSKMN